jgi:hypothetical protein
MGRSVARMAAITPASRRPVPAVVKARSPSISRNPCMVVLLLFRGGVVRAVAWLRWVGWSCRRIDDRGAPGRWCVSSLDGRVVAVAGALEECHELGFVTDLVAVLGSEGDDLIALGEEEPW